MKVTAATTLCSPVGPPCSVLVGEFLLSVELPNPQQDPRIIQCGILSTDSLVDVYDEEPRN